MMSKNALHEWRHDLRGPAVLCLIAAFAPSLLAQTAGAGALTGTVTAVPVALIGNALIAAVSARPDQANVPSTETLGPVVNLLPPGNFTGSFETACFDFVEILSATVNVTDMALLGRQSAMAAQTKDDKTAAPQDKAAKPSLQDLGFPPDQAQGNAEAQARLDKRSHMLKIHQRLGLITLIPMIATIFAGGGAGGHGSASGRNLHGALGLVTAGMYVTTASYAIRAPSVPGMEVRGPIRVHKALAWVHGAGMILTPILGAMARAQLDRGEKVHGIAAAHSAVADVTVAAYAAAIGSVALKF
jgi:hypothetical protein